METPKTEALFGEAGLSVGQLRPAGDGLFEWRLLPGINHDFDIDDRRIDYSYEGSPGSILSIAGRDLDTTSGIAGGGIFYHGERAGLGLEYRGRFNDDYDEQWIAATVSVRF